MDPPPNYQHQHFGQHMPGVDFEQEERVKTLRESLNPPRIASQSCIVIPYQGRNFVVRTGMISHLPHYHGIDYESPYLHVKEFEEIVRTMLERNQNEVDAFMKLFYFTLK